MGELIPAEGKSFTQSHTVNYRWFKKQDWNPGLLCSKHLPFGILYVTTLSPNLQSRCKRWAFPLHLSAKMTGK